jgi:hypothetical protein
MYSRYLRHRCYSLCSSLVDISLYLTTLGAAESKNWIKSWPLIDIAGELSLAVMALRVPHESFMTAPSIVQSVSTCPILYLPIRVVMIAELYDCLTSNPGFLLFAVVDFRHVLHNASCKRPNAAVSNKVTLVAKLLNIFRSEVS